MPNTSVYYTWRQNDKNDRNNSNDKDNSKKWNCNYSSNINNVGGNKNKNDKVDTNNNINSNNYHDNDKNNNNNHYDNNNNIINYHHNRSNIIDKTNCNYCNKESKRQPRAFTIMQARPGQGKPSRTHILRRGRQDTRSQLRREGAREGERGIKAPCPPALPPFPTPCSLVRLLPCVQFKLDHTVVVPGMLRYLREPRIWLAVLSFFYFTAPSFRWLVFPILFFTNEMKRHGALEALIAKHTLSRPSRVGGSFQQYVNKPRSEPLWLYFELFPPHSGMIISPTWSPFSERQ